MKQILGLDLGTASIGWARVCEAQSSDEESEIIKLGVRVNPLTVDEQKNFEQGKSITTNADRTLKRSMRRSLQRYKLRREALIEILKEHGFISDETILSENGNFTTFQTCRLRAKAATERLTLEELARVLLMINKKRGYKSSRKVKNSEEGTLIDGMGVAKRLYEEDMTPAELVVEILEKGGKTLPDFYSSDLRIELNKIWTEQKKYHPEILTDTFYEKIKGKSGRVVAAIFNADYHFYPAENKGKDKILQAYKWRVEALKHEISKEELAFVLCDINGKISASSGYLGEISDRSKELYFNDMTVGQYQMAMLEKNPNHSLRNQVFYRQDYLNEFEKIWETQSGYHSELTPELKKEVRDVIIFYQRALRSQKGLISFCEFESRQIEVGEGKDKKIRTIGNRVCPKSSPLFQEFKVWQRLNDLKITEIATGAFRYLDKEEKDALFAQLKIRDKMSNAEALNILVDKPKYFKLNFDDLEGNRTQNALFSAYLKIVENSGHGEFDLKKEDASKISDVVKEVFTALGFNTEILDFNALSDGLDFEKQPMYMLWHLLYSYQGDKNSTTGNGRLIEKLCAKYGFDEPSAKILANVTFQDDYGSLSSKAIRKIMPHLMDGYQYDEACSLAGYRHSKSSLTWQEIEDKVLKPHLDILPKNSLRNPVVEKILNQMVNVVNGVIDTYGPIDEIHVEMARELKKNAAEREDMSREMNRVTKLHAEYEKILKEKFGFSYVSRRDIIRYKLYLELEKNGFKTLYSNTYIPKEKLFSGEFDIEHIIPQAKLFDDSFSNKTIEKSDVNRKKSNYTAMDFIKNEYGEEAAQQYEERIDRLYKEGVLSKSKRDKLKMTEEKIPSDFISRDLRDSQYIAKKAKQMLEQISKRVYSTTGSITDRLREDWQLVDIMKELNWNKYNEQGLTYNVTDKDGRIIRKITDWTKRNDHRHHAMDALTIAFTKHSHIQYLNNLNARRDESNEKHNNILGIEKAELEKDDKGKLRFKAPILPVESFRAEAKKHLESILVSIKSKNKVVTNNTNKIKIKGGNVKITQQTPRGQLHNETVYGSIKRLVFSDVKVGSSFTEEMIGMVAKKSHREALLQRLAQYDGDAKKAFTGKNSLDKNPIYLDEKHTVTMPEKVRIAMYETIYTIRKEISPDIKVDKVIDGEIRQILQKRLDEFGGNSANAFSNLDENPIWLNKEKGIAIKRVTISGVNNVEALHDKKDKDGNKILTDGGESVPTDFVSTSNNHHVAIYRDENGVLQEKVTSFYEAVARINAGEPVIDKGYNKENGWAFLFTMKQNEYFVFPNEKTGFNPNDIDLLDPINASIISHNLFRVQALSTKDYFFRHHLETNISYNNALKGMTWIRTGLNGIKGIIKVRVNHIGQIVAVGEY